MSTTSVETWTGADLSTIGPIYPMVGTEVALVIAGVGLWLLFHFVQARIESKELAADEEAAKSSDRLMRVFEEEGKGS